MVGDSATGATQKFDGPYFAIRFVLKQPGPFSIMPLVGDPSATRFNVVPRDFVVNAIAALSARTDNVGVCYQLADPAPLTVVELIDTMEQETGKKLVKIPDEAQPYLERMGLADPQTTMEKLLRRAIVYALVEDGAI